jgi:hypothetical protein
MRWTRVASLLLIEFDGCGHQMYDRAPKSSMTATEISAWVERMYGNCPQCRSGTIDRGLQ